MMSISQGGFSIGQNISLVVIAGKADLVDLITSHLMLFGSNSFHSYH